MCFSHRTMKGKCHKCFGIVAYTEVSFPTINDYGAIVSQCENCQEKFKISIKNPKESDITKGAKKISYLDFDCEEDKSEALKYNELLEKILYDINLNEKLTVYPHGGAVLYKCKACGKELESSAYSALLAQKKGIDSANYNAINYILAHSRMPDYKKIIVCVEFTCDCREIYKAIFYRNYNEHSWADCDAYLLADVTGALDLDEVVDGIVTKNYAMELLCKLIIRWNLFSQKILIATPFVGHQHMNDDQLMEVWSSILRWLDHNKSIIYTKTATVNAFKKAFKGTSGIDYSMLVEYELGNFALDGTNKKNDFHAKFFAGISGHSVECMSGSANLVSGPSLENINLSKYSDYSSFYSRYLKPFKSSNFSDSLPTHTEYSVLIKRSTAGCFSWFDSKFEDYSNV